MTLKEDSKENLESINLQQVQKKNRQHTPKIQNQKTQNIGDGSSWLTSIWKFLFGEAVFDAVSEAGSGCLLEGCSSVGCFSCFLVVFIVFLLSILTNPFATVKVGDYVKFGTYPQTENGEVRSIEWQVLAKKGNKILVISRYGLDARRFDSNLNNWKNSEIRKWLNGDFYNKAFNEKEKKSINSFYGDNVFLFSREEAEKYFANNDERRCKPTEYAVKNGADVYNGYSWWWLRSPSPNYDGSDGVYIVSRVGAIDYDSNVNVYDIMVRPALWIKL